MDYISIQQIFLSQYLIHQKQNLPTDKLDLHCWYRIGNCYIMLDDITVYCIRQRDLLLNMEKIATNNKNESEVRIRTDKIIRHKTLFENGEEVPYEKCTVERDHIKLGGFNDVIELRTASGKFIYINRKNLRYFDKDLRFAAIDKMKPVLIYERDEETKKFVPAGLTMGFVPRYE